MTKRDWTICIAVPLLLFAAACAGGMYLLYSAFGPPDPAAFRQRLESANVLPALTHFAERLSAGDHPRDQDPDVQQLYSAGVHAFRPIQEGDRVVAVEFEFGGADRHHGVIISPTDPKKIPAALITTYTEPWGDQIWFYSEIPPRR
jgi:hypothetical protein